MNPRKNSSLLILPGLLFLIIAIFMNSCSEVKKEKKFRIGFSQCTGSDNWRKSMFQAMQRELSFHPGTELLYRDASDNSDLQVQQIKDLLKENIDILLVSPNEAQPLTPVVEEVFTKGIPVVVLDRKTASNLYTSFVGADNYQIGQLAATYIAHTLNGKGNIVEVVGLPGSTPAIEREKGFSDGLRKYPDLRIISEIYGNWKKEQASSELEKALDKLSRADVIFAHNDLMALGAQEVCKKYNLNQRIKFIGVDGLPGPGGGIEFVADKILNATVLYPTGGEEAIQTAFKILNKESFEKQNTLQTLVIDSTNVRLMTLQTDKINSQQKDIERQTEMLNQQLNIYNSQRSLLNTTIVALILIFVLGGFSFYSWRNNKKINLQLAAQNKEIISQTTQLQSMSEIAQQANEAKLNFFTNISHEFRTPLSLILAPLESIRQNPKLPLPLKQNLEFINKNVLRLLRLVNQLMDFRKIEHGKMKVKVTENNLGDFVKEIAEEFRTLAQKKYISFNLLLQERILNVWFDSQMLDKVLFNLLSNAYKFTNEHGFINITVSKDLATKMAVIRIEDSGVGMNPEAVQHAFDLFFQADEASLKGTGIGLALSKQLITLHHGTIDLKSEKWKGSVFEIRIPLGNSHFSADEIDEGKKELTRPYDDVRIYSLDAASILSSKDQSEMNGHKSTAAKEHSVLIIEDSTDMRSFLKLHLEPSYEICEAENSTVGLNMAFDVVPDLIICDIILPGDNGLSITEKLKNDIRTSHIPIIILTAKVEIENQIESLRLKADAFITKPFNLQFLEEMIRNLLRNRESLKEHYTSELPTEIRTGVSKKIDRKFLNEFAAIVENNISNENFSVEIICREIGISRVQLYRKLKALLGVNVNDYILNVRLQKGKYLLTNEDITISEIAFKVGFSSQAYFSTVFKSKFSCTPSEFRDAHKL
jgi:signal transduction histidine kinase/DNA-binding response OmpR family regulator